MEKFGLFFLMLTIITVVQAVEYEVDFNGKETEIIRTWREGADDTERDASTTVDVTWAGTLVDDMVQKSPAVLQRSSDVSVNVSWNSSGKSGSLGIHAGGNTTVFFSYTKSNRRPTDGEVLMTSSDSQMITVVVKNKTVEYVKSAESVSRGYMKARRYGKKWHLIETVKTSVSTKITSVDGQLAHQEATEIEDDLIMTWEPSALSTPNKWSGGLFTVREKIGYLSTILTVGSNESVEAMGEIKIKGGGSINGTQMNVDGEMGGEVYVTERAGSDVIERRTTIVVVDLTTFANYQVKPMIPDFPDLFEDDWSLMEGHPLGCRSLSIPSLSMSGDHNVGDQSYVMSVRGWSWSSLCSRH